jgi:hypothetical protein
MLCLANCKEWRMYSNAYLNNVRLLKKLILTLTKDDTEAWNFGNFRASNFGSLPLGEGGGVYWKNLGVFFAERSVMIHAIIL